MGPDRPRASISTARPLLVVSDGAPGVIKAIEVCFPRSARQRCLAHRMRNLAVKVPEDLWPEFKARAAAACQAPSRKIARELADGLSADHGTELVNATACFMDDFEACIAHLRLPINNNVFDVYIALGFGALGYFMLVFGFPAAPLLLGFILGPLMEEHRVAR
jgi:hypothetical protein